jgi:hypothetical protein
MLLGMYSISNAALVVNLNAGSLSYGTITSWTNTGSLGGSFTASGNPTVAIVGGKKAVSFDGNDSFVSTFSVPSGVTGNHAYTVSVWAYNPSIASEECMVNWAKRETTSRAAQLNYGSNTDYGAVTHWANDMGFDSGVPSAGSWHHIAVTYQGGTDSQETVYVDGQRNAIEFKTLDLWPSGLFYLGCAIQNNGTTKTLYFSGSLAQVLVYDTELSEAQIKAMSDGIVITETRSDTTVSESGTTDTYEVALGMQPSSNVTVAIANDGRVHTNVSSLMFTSSNWATPQTVTVSAVDNKLIEGAKTSVLTHTASSTDPILNGRTIKLNVTVLDNDRLGDLSNDGTINLPDLLLIAQAWLNNCVIDAFCDGSDLTGLIGQTSNPGTVDMQDIRIISNIWQQGPILITEFMASNGNNFVTTINGLEEDPDWIELYNAGPMDINLSGWHLTDDMNNLNQWPFPSVILKSGRYLIVFASGQDTNNYVDDLGYLHTNFSLSTDGENLAVVQPDGTISHYWKNYPPQVTNYSYGLEMKTQKYGYFDPPTPDSTNGTPYDGFVADTKFSHNRGFYTTPFNVEITCSTSGAAIRYTTDGSEPTETVGTTYTAPIAISKTTCLRAKAFKTGLIPTNTDTQTYMFLENFWSQSRPTGYPTATYDSYNPLDYDIDQDVIGPANLFGNVYRNTYMNDLKAFPSLSIVMNVDDLFGITKGIYANSIQEGDAWERAASVEFMDPNEGGLFQIDCAIRLQGGYSRNAFESPKHNFRFIFKRPYGPGKLDYKLFSDSNVHEFDQLIVRTPCHDSWLTQQAYFRAYGLYAKDGWHREIQRQMGHNSIHGQWVHLYLNGLYWGIYEVVERPNASFAASYEGGKKEQYDCVSSETLRDGTVEAWETMNIIAAGGGTYGSISNAAAYQQLQQYLDVTNLSDYIIINIYSAISDWPGWNYYACRKIQTGAQFKFYCWDSEASMMDDRLNYNKLDEFTTGIGGAGTLYSYLIANADFRLLFADRLHKHLHNGGALNPTNAAAVFQSQLNRVAAGMGPESARWGDAWEATPLTKADWLSDQTWLFSTFFPQRGEIILGFFRTDGVYPETNPPTFSRYTGYASAGNTLTMTNPNTAGTIYYTLNGSDPKTSGTLYSSAITLSQSVHVKARILNGTEWSAQTEAVIAVGVVAQNLRITELMYHPADPNTEFVELKNIGTQTIQLSLVQFTKGVNFTFPSMSLNAGEYVVVVQNSAAFAAKYPSYSGKIAGQYTGQLENAGETIELCDALGTIIHQFDYADGWYDITDGQGFSLTVKNPAAADMTLWNAKAGWRPSAQAGGSPGSDDSGLVPAIGTVVINELLAHSHSAASDWIELHNTIAQAVNIGGWFLSDSNVNEPNIMKYEIPQGASIPANGYVVFYETETFNNTTAQGCHTPFSLSEGGETLYLQSGQDGALTGYSEEESFDASDSNVAFGRYYKASTDSYNFVAMSSNTPGLPNAYPKVGPIVISQIYYNPEVRTGDSYENNEYEFIKLTNISSQTVNLWLADTDYGVNMPWTFTDGIEYIFDAGVTIAAGQSIYVVKNKTAFSQRFPSISTAKIYGPYSGKLDNAGEKVELSMPGDQESTVRYYIRVDRVVYDDEAPWPTSADGGDASLNRITLTAYGNDYINWQAATVNP